MTPAPVNVRRVPATDADDRAERDVAHVERVRGSEQSPRYYWQVTAKNGRVLGRSHAVYADRNAASEACASLGRRVAFLVVTVEHADVGLGWRWRIDDPRVRDAASRTVSVSARTFERHGSCARAGTRMLHSLAALANR